ncbi:Hint domain-containing protein [Palleronia abyssalis]|uniref:Hedgehog/Intein (Hint) domain-containing protein n=1 Tax=Palleronia abyssalis TaxID=1501240 RepID=A0A2R8BZB3_9RHOB|nr:Hint domain-containing protein [Palleronia abyssalis]SPJ25479.1 hypothetical protein PAA8504_03330 [Palleronia abyssalis]
MALISLDLGSSDQTIDGNNANDGDTVNIRALGSQTLTVDGVDVTITNLANAQLGAEPIFSAINGANLTFGGGLANISALNGITYRIGGNSQIEVNGSLLSAQLNNQRIDFTGTQDGRFTYDPGGISVGDPAFDVTGLEPGDQLAVEGRDNFSFDYDDDTGQATLQSASFLGLGEDVTYRFALDTERANLIRDNPDQYIDDGVFTYPFLNLVCFVAGTLIITNQGARPVEELEEGDLVLTIDRGFQPIVWHGRITRNVSGKLRPIRIKAGTLRNTRDLVVSPQHKVMVPTDGTPAAFDQPHILIPAKHLLGRCGVTQEPAGVVEYHHIMFDTHEIIFSEGIPTESFHPGEMGLSAFDAETRAELYDLFPELADKAFLEEIAAARMVAKKHEAQLVLDGLARVGF